MHSQTDVTVHLPHEILKYIFLLSIENLNDIFKFKTLNHLFNKWIWYEDYLSLREFKNPEEKAIFLLQDFVKLSPPKRLMWLCDVFQHSKHYEELKKIALAPDCPPNSYIAYAVFCKDIKTLSNEKMEQSLQLMDSDLQRFFQWSIYPLKCFLNYCSCESDTKHGFRNSFQCSASSCISSAAHHKTVPFFNFAGAHIDAFLLTASGFPFSLKFSNWQDAKIIGLHKEKIKLNFYGANFRNATIKEVEFIGCCLLGADFRGATLSHLVIESPAKGKFEENKRSEKINFQDTTLKNVDFAAEEAGKPALLKYYNLKNAQICDTFTYIFLDFSETEMKGIKFLVLPNEKTVINCEELNNIFNKHKQFLNHEQPHQRMLIRNAMLDQFINFILKNEVMTILEKIDLLQFAKGHEIFQKKHFDTSRFMFWCKNLELLPADINHCEAELQTVINDFNQLLKLELEFNPHGINANAAIAQNRPTL